MINSQDIKKGTCIRLDGKLYFCIDFLHVKPGKGNTIMRTTLKDVVRGNVIERRFNIGEKLEDVRVERRPYQYLYQEGEEFIFMNQETFEQIPIAKSLINGADFMKEDYDLLEECLNSIENALEIVAVDYYLDDDYFSTVMEFLRDNNYEREVVAEEYEAAAFKILPHPNDETLEALAVARMQLYDLKA